MTFYRKSQKSFGYFSMSVVEICSTSQSALWLYVKSSHEVIGNCSLNAFSQHVPLASGCI